MEDETLNVVRNTFQKGLIPCVVFIGILGNILSVIVLSSRRMRCSTNVYLTALAVSDIIFLAFSFSLTLKHYPLLHETKYEFYWKCIGIQTWINDASTYISIYLAVSFTVERYIAVCHPIRGQVLCTESRAKRVIAVVVIVCLALTASTAFEWQLRTDLTYYNALTGEPCNHTKSQNDIDNLNSNYLFDNETNLFALTNTNESLNYDDNLNRVKINLVANNNASKIFMEDVCIKKVLLNAEMSEFGNNQTYSEIFLTFTSFFFIILPLILLATFNWFLVAAVHRSQRLRYTMTNTRQGENRTSQENKITIILIAVVLLFLVCQIPTGSFLIYSSWIKPAIVDHYTDNALKALGNVLNFLVAINAGFNFVLYCVLSDQYRKTVKELFCGKNIEKQNTVSSIRYKFKAKNNKTKENNGNSEENRNKNDETRITEMTLLDEQKHVENKSPILLTRKLRLPPPPEENLLTTVNGSLSSAQRSQSLNNKPPIKHSLDCKSNKLMSS